MYKTGKNKGIYRWAVFFQNKFELEIGVKESSLGNAATVPETP